MVCSDTWHGQTRTQNLMSDLSFTIHLYNLVFLTWCHVSEPDGCHGDKTEVEGVEKGPVLTKKQKNDQYDIKSPAKKKNETFLWKVSKK